MSEAQDIFIVSGVRTAIGDFGGALKGFAASDLGARVVAEAVNRAGLQPADIGHVVLGQVFITGAKDAYIARVAALNAGVPVETPALTVNRLCGSGVQAIISAAQMMKLGEASITVAGGAESMSNVPYHDHGVRWGKKMGNNVLVDALTLGLSDPIGEYHMGVTAENVAEKCGVSREAQDQLAVEGHVRAARAIAEQGDANSEAIAAKLHLISEAVALREYSWTSPDGLRSYAVAVNRPYWLLPSTFSGDTVIWVPKRLTMTVCAAKSAR